MWYGVLGTKELLHRTYKNLEQKVLLEVRKKNALAWLNLSFSQPSHFLLFGFWFGTFILASFISLSTENKPSGISFSHLESDPAC